MKKQQLFNEIEIHFYRCEYYRFNRFTCVEDSGLSEVC